MNNHKYWFRLIKNNKPIGFMKYNDKKKPLFSIDNYGWNTTKINYDISNPWAGIYDRNNYPLFKNDVVALRTTTQPNPKKKYLIIYKKEHEQFFLKALKSNEILTLFVGDLPIIQKQELTFIGTYLSRH